MTEIKLGGIKFPNQLTHGLKKQTNRPTPMVEASQRMEKSLPEERAAKLQARN